jgi:hypothetical protein
MRFSCQYKNIKLFTKAITNFNYNFYPKKYKFQLKPLTFNFNFNFLSFLAERKWLLNGRVCIHACKTPKVMLEENKKPKSKQCVWMKYILKAF